jgi:hypothetical protein
MSAEVRTAIYTLAVSIVALVVGYGLITEEQGALWLAVIAGFIGSLTAFINRPTK